MHAQSLAVLLRHSRLIAIDGGSALGKTTLAHELGSILHATVIGIDSYLIPRAQRTMSPYELSSIRVDDFYRDLQLLLAGTPILIGEYDKAAGKNGTPTLRRPTSPLIIEGVHAFALLAAAGIPATRIFLDGPEAVMRARRASRDQGMGRTDYVDRWDEHYAAYLRVVMPWRELADIICPVASSSR